MSASNLNMFLSSVYHSLKCRKMYKHHTRIREHLENEISFFQSGKTQGICKRKTHKKNQEKLREFDSGPCRRERFSPVGVCALCHVSKLCPLTDWLFVCTCSVNVYECPRAQTKIDGNDSDVVGNNIIQ